MLSKALSKRWITLLFLVFLAGLYVTGRAQEMVAERKKAPELIQVTPQEVTPGTEIEIEGYRLGWPQLKDTQVVFWQNAIPYTTYPTGGGWQAKDIDNGLQQMKVVVPQGINPGFCSLVVEANGFDSIPIPLEIGLSINPPIITETNSRWVAPGEVVWVKGTGFGVFDEIELIDSKGEFYYINPGSTSSAIKVAFNLPPNVAEGEALVRVIEHRSGKNQPSNPIPVMISRGPVPLELMANWLPGVAAGQWLDLVIASFKPLEKADKAEILFNQGEQPVVVEIQGNTYPRVHIPNQLLPGNVKISTRTWIKNKASVWSDPIDYTLRNEPVPPSVISMEIVGWNEPIYLGPTTPKTFNLQGGDTLVLRGNFPVSNTNKLRLVLRNSANTISLIPTFLDPGSIKVKLPNNLLGEDWELTLKSTENKAFSKLPINLHIN
ncbi:MAG: hypothetical protein HY819_18710 [Acidobacteria bacterium]|nr:hypothetical protein [Acidobacteriota bacterium]